jgi:hypothetical protein
MRTVGRRAACTLAIMGALFLPATAASPVPLTFESIQKTVGPEWHVGKIPEGFLLTSIRPVIFLPAVSPSTKMDFNQQIATARRDFMRIKIVRGAPVGDVEIASLSMTDYVLPEIAHQSRLAYYPCWDAATDTQREYLEAHRSTPLYLVSNAGPDENIYPASESDPCLYDHTILRVAKLCDFPENLHIED